ncbi:hypothetical protein DRQ33_01955 [bacterium]|mgnify:CR=1 FL=1|nr:MAG: hypothetical protein DRQ33_01955 [bacterium]
MSERINLALGFHIHQPVGNFESVFEYATRVAYNPLINALNKHPKIPFAIHISGPVWEYFEDKHPDIFESIAAMIQRGQCELMSGGFYEPILSVIPPQDAKGQLEMMSDYIYEKFGVIPTGIWLAERIWEPHLPTILKQADIKYLAVDDYHLKSVGIENEALLGYFISENVGDEINIFPISELLRYTIPFAEVDKTIDYLRSIADQSGNRLIVFADDGEKFGLWPGTENWVWKQGWMEKFLSALENNQSWINMMTFSEVQNILPPLKRIYMPTGSYFEMSEWTLPPKLSYQFHKFVQHLEETDEIEKFKPFVKGGFWRNFLTKYHESNWMHKRMLWISRQIHSRKRRLNTHYKDALTALYRAQCNCAYWHGVFGGLYLPHLREGIWNNILTAEKIIETHAPTRKYLSQDIDKDGNDEIRLNNNDVIVWISPTRGGCIEEISFLPTNTNLINTLARYEEGYHKLIWEAQHSEEQSDEHSSIHNRVIVKEAGLENKLQYDWYPRRFAQDHFMLSFTGIEEFARQEYYELGDFVNQKYEFIDKHIVKNELDITLQRNGGLWFEGKKFPVVITKQIKLAGPGNHIFIHYEIENRSDWRDFLFGVETNFSLLSRDDPKRHFEFPHESLNRIHPGARKSFLAVDGYELIDEGRKLRLSCRCQCDGVWLLPVETVSNSESGFERVYQQTCVVHLFRFNIGAGEKFKTEIMWKLEHL